MIKKIINVYKPIGISPLDAIIQFKDKFPEYNDVSITYAGRLDPVAEGVLLLLAEDEVYSRDEYIKLDKEYEAEILFGLETDTYDVLGVPLTNQRTAQLVEPFVGLREKVEDKVKDIVGTVSLPLPPYSSYKIDGKPLFEWAREGKLNEIEIPQRVTTLYTAEVLDSYEILESDLYEQITEKVSLVKGDFRQGEILQSWGEVLSGNKDEKYFVVKIKFAVSSGTYIRSIAQHLGEILGTGALLLSLVRTKVGDFEIKDSIKV